MSAAPITVRLAMQSDAAAIAAVHVTAWQESYSGLMPKETLERLSVADRAARWRRILDGTSKGVVVFVAERQGGIVGFASRGDQRNQTLHAQGFTGEITAIYLLNSAKGKGIGGQMMAAMSRSLSGDGHEAASLWVLRDNHPARRFYERLGGRIVSEHEERDDDGLVEIAYGWRDLKMLIGAGESC